MKKKATSEVSYAQALGHASGDKRIEILRLIGASGSISQAAREAGVSYKAAWQAVDTLTNLAGVVLVERAVGGVGGGGAGLSAAGLQLLAAADALAQARSRVLDQLLLMGGGMPSFSQLSVRTSMRNQLPCRVQALEVMGHIVRVTLALPTGARGGAATASTADTWVAGPAGARLVARITHESAELLALQPGLPVLALCKATAVAVQRLTPTIDREDASANVLAGRAVRVSKGQTGDEVSLRLEAGLQLVGFAAPSSGIRIGSRVAGSLDEAAVVLALPA